MAKVKVKLQKYLDEKNKLNKIFGDAYPLYEVKTSEGRKRLRDRIEADLSPENLSCDGELSKALVLQRYKLYIGAASELNKLDPALPEVFF